MTPGTDALLSRVGATRRDEIAALDTLDELLASQLEAGAAAWGSVRIDADRYAAQLATALELRTDEPARRILDGATVDLYLAAACVARVPGAAEAFAIAVTPPLRRALTKLGAPPSVVDEVVQRVLVECLADPVRPRIASYAGRGRLTSWVQTIGVRMCRRWMGELASAGGADVDDLDRLPGAMTDAERQLRHARHAPAFRAAFETALASLTPRERNLLRQHHLDGLTIDRLGAMYRVDRATVARRIAALRRRVLEATREAIADDLDVPVTEVDTFLRSVRGSFGSSLRALFAR